MTKVSTKKNPGFVLQGIILASASILVRIIGLIYRIPLTNILGDEGNAFYSNAFEVYNIALLLSSYSIPLAVSKLVSARVHIGERSNAFRVFKAAFVFAGTVGLVVSFIIFFGADYIADTIMKMPMSSYALKVLAPCLFVVAVLGVMRGYCQGIGTTIPTALSQVFEQIINAVVSIVAASYLFQFGMSLKEYQENQLLAPAYGAAGGTTGTIAGAIAALGFMIFVLFLYKKVIKKQIAREQFIVPESYRDIFKVLMLTIVPVVMSTGIYNINSIIDQAMYNNIMVSQGYTQAEYATLWGIFSGKYTVLLNVPLGISSALAVSVIPSLAAAYASKNRSEVYEKIGLAMRLSMLIAMPSFIVFLIYSRNIQELLFNDNTNTAMYILSLGSISVIFYCLSTITNAILQGIDRMVVPIRNALISLVIHLLSLYIMLEFLKWNIYGVIISKIIFALSMCILNSRALYRVIRYKQEYKKTFFLPLLAAVIMGVVSYGAHFGLTFLIPSKVNTVLTLVVAGGIYVIGLIKLKALDEEELMTIPKGGKIIKLLKKVHLL